MADSKPINPGISFQDYVRYTDLRRDIIADPVKIKAESSQYDAGFILPQVNPEQALMDHRANAQPWEDKLGNGLMNMTSSAFTGALESTLGLVYGAGAALASGDASKFYNNEFGKSIDAFTEATREKYPFYYSKAEEDASLLSSLGTANFWYDKVLGGAGYTIGSMVTGMGAARAFNIGKNARLAQLSAEASAAETAGNLTAEAAKFARWDMGKQAALGFTIAHGESSMEARQTYEETKQNYEKLRSLAQMDPSNPEYADYLNLSDEKIEQLASDAADTNYLMNLAVTGPTNMMLLGKWINPGKQAAIRTYNEIGKRTAVDGATQYFDKVVTQKGRALLNVGSKFMKGFTLEGSQEGLQFASNKAAQEFVELHGLQGQDWFTSLTTGLAEGLGETLSTKEGLEAILVGGLVGGPFGMRGAGAERTAKDARTKILVDKLNSDPTFVQANPLVQKMLASTNSANNAETYLKNGDLFNAKNAADQSLNTYIKGQIDAGTTDYFVERLESIKQMDQTERDKFFGPGTTPAQVDQVIDKVRKLEGLYNSIETLYGTPGGTPEQKQRNTMLREMLFFSASTIKDVEGRMSNIVKELTAMANPQVAAIIAAREIAINMQKTITPESVPAGKDFEQYLAEMEDQAVKGYNALLTQFIKDNPVEASQTTQLFADLNQLDKRKQEFIKYYNELNDPEKAEALLKKTQETLEKTGERLQMEAEREKEKKTQGRTVLQDVDTFLPLNPDRKNEVTNKGQVLDISKLSNIQLDEMQKNLQQEETQGTQVLPELKAAIAKEIEFRTTTDQIRLGIKERLLGAVTPEQVDDIISQIANDGSFNVNAQEIEKLKKNLTEANEARIAQEAIAENMKNNFKGVNEFFHVFTTSEEEKRLVAQVTSDPELKNKVYFKLSTNPNPGTISNIGKAETNTLNPRLKKQSPNILIEVWTTLPDNTQARIGMMPWFGQYVNNVGNPIDIQNLTFDEYVNLFLPGLDKQKAAEFIASDPLKYDLEAFKRAHADMMDLYAGAQKLMENAIARQLSPGETRSLVGVSVSQGTYNFDDAPLSDFLNESTVNKPFVLNGTPVIISTSTFDGSVEFRPGKEILPTMTVASVLDADGNPVVLDVNGVGGLRAELLPALNALSQRVTQARVGENIYNKYWMIVEDPQGTVKIPGVEGSFDWRPVSPKSMTPQQVDEILNNLRATAEKHATLKDASEKDKNMAVLRNISNKLFIAVSSFDAVKSFKNVQIGFTLSPTNKLTLEVDFKFKPGNMPRNQAETADVNQGKVYMTVPDNIRTSQDLINWFNQELQKDQTLVYKPSMESKGTERVPFSMKGRLAPITHTSMRMNFSSGSAEQRRGIRAINPTNVWDSFSVNVSRLNPRVDQKVVVQPVRTAAGAAMAQMARTSSTPPVTATPQTVTLAPGLTSGQGEVAPTTPVSTDIITDNIYNNFVDKNIVPENVLNFIADKVINRSALSQKEIAIFNGKTSEINKIIRNKAALGAPTTPAAPAAIMTMERLNQVWDDIRNGKPVDSFFNEFKEGYGSKYLFVEDLKDWFENKTNTKVAVTTTPGRIAPNAAAAPTTTTTIDAEKAKITSSEFTELKRLAKFFLENPKEPTVSGSVVTRYPTLFKTVTDIEKRRQKELEGEKYFVKTNAEGLKAAKEFVDRVNAKYDAELDALGAAPAQERPSRRKSAGGDAFTGANSIGTYDEGEVIDRETAIENIKGLLPEFISIGELLPTLEALRDGRITFGSFYNNMVRLASKLVKGREYHEAFHAVFRTMFTDKQLDALYKEAKALMISEFKKQGKTFVQAYAEWKEDRIDYESLPESIKKDLFIEEWMADEYPKWREGKSVVPKKSTTLLGKIFNAIKRFADWLTGTPTLGEVFQSLDEGKFSGAKNPVMNRFTSGKIDTMARSQIYVGNRMGTNGITYASYLDPSLEMVLVNTIASRVMEAQKTNPEAPADYLIEMEILKLGDKFNVDDPIYNPIADNPSYNDVFEKVQDLDFLFNDNTEHAIEVTKMIDGKQTVVTEKRNFGKEARTMFKDKIKKQLDEYSVDDYSFDANEDNADGESNTTERNFDQNFENKGGFTSLSQFLRKYIGQTTYNTTLDEFFGLEPGSVFGGEVITVAVNPKKVYNGLTKLTANQLSPEKVLRKLAYAARESSESGRFAGKFLEEAGISFDQNGVLTYDKDKTALIQSVVKGFSNVRLNYLFTQFDRFYGKEEQPFARVFMANTRGMDVQQLEAWSNQFNVLTKRNGKTEMTRRAENVRGMQHLELTSRIDDAVVEQVVTALKSDLEGLGISLSRMYLKYLVLQNRVQKSEAQRQFIEEFEKEVQVNAKDVHESLIRVVQSIAKGGVPFERKQEKPSEEDMSAVTRLRKIAMDNAVFDENVSITTMVNADGKNIYPYQKANYHVQRMLELQEIDFTQTDEDGNLLYPSEVHSEQPNQDYVLNNYLLNNPDFREMLKSAKIDRIDGMKQTTLEERGGDLKVVMDGKDREGATYGGMTERELMLQFYSLFADSSTDTKVNFTMPDGSVERRNVPSRRMAFNIMEASNTLDVLNMPVQTVYQNGKLTDKFKQAVIDNIARELNRINKVRAGEYVDINGNPIDYVNFNSYNSADKLRGLKFWENERLLSSIGIKNQLESGEISLEEALPIILDGMDTFFNNELAEHMEALKDAGILKEDGTNRLLPGKFTGIGIVDSTGKSDTMFSTVMTDNIGNAYFNMYLNATAIDQILMGDPALTLKDSTDWFKRAKGNNAAGDNMLHFDPANNAPVKTLVFGRETDKGTFDDFVNTDYVKEERIYKKGSKEYNDFAASLPEEEREAFLAKDAEEIKVGDAQAYTSVAGMLRFQTNLGRMTTRGEAIYKSIMDGKKLTQEDWEYLKDNGLMLNSQKFVYYDGVTYVKMSIVPLTPEYTTTPAGTPIKGMEFLHNLRIQMEANNIEMAGQPSMMKKMIRNPLVIGEGQTDFVISPENVIDLDLRYLRLQQENPSNKTTIKDPTQMIHLIAAEQDPSTPIDFPWDPSIKTVGQLVKKYDSLLAERIRTQYIPARNYLTQLQEGNRTLDTKRLVKAFRKMLETTGASQQLLDFLRTDDAGYPIENFNMPHIVTAFEQHFNNYFNKIFSQKVPGYKTTLQSGFGHKLIYDTKTGKLIPRNVYLENPSKYDNDPNIGTRDLGFDIPHIVDGKEVYKYSEVILPFHFAEQFGLKPGDEIPLEIADMFGTRIPSQDKHSSRVLRVVDVMPASYGSNMIFPHELILLTGSDFDVDSYFNQRFDHYVKDGEFRVYGNNKDSKWDQFMKWNMENNSMLRDVAKEIKLEYPDTPAQDIFAQALKTLGLPSTEEEFNKSGMRSVGEINNDILRAKMVLHSNPSMDKINKTPATLDAIQNSNGTGVLDQLATRLGYASWKQLEKSYNPTSMMGMVNAFVTNKAGSKAIGAAVNNSQVYAVLTRFGLQTVEENKSTPEVEISGYKIGSISPSNFLTEDGKRIMDLLSTLTSSMTDNTKYGYNSKMNVDINTLSVVSLMTMNRIPLMDAVMMINSEYVRTLVKESRGFAIQNESEASYQNEAYERLINVLRTKVKELDPTLLDEFEKQENMPVTAEDLALAMDFSPERKEFKTAKPGQRPGLLMRIPVEYYFAQMRILSAYNTMSQKHVGEYIAFSQIMKLTKGISSSNKETSFKGDEEIKQYLDTLGLQLTVTREGWRVEYKSKEAKEKQVYDFASVINSHLITLENLAVFGEKGRIQKTYFISQTDFSEAVKERILANINPKLGRKKKAKALAAMRDNLLGYMMIKAWRKRNNVTENMNAYIFDDVAEKEGRKPLATFKDEIIAANRHLENNLVFTQVFFGNKSGISTAKYSTWSKGQKGFEALLLGDMRQLANSEARPLVHQMIKYMISKDAMLFKNDSPISLINPSTLGVYNFSQLLTEMTPMLNQMNDAQFQEMFGMTKNELLAEFTDMFMRDVNNRAYVPRVKNAEILENRDTEKAKTVHPVTKLANGGFKVNFDAGYRMVDEETGDEIRPTDDVKAKQQMRNKIIFGQFGFVQSSDSFKNKKGETKRAKAFEFPTYLQAGPVLYKLVAYVKVENRFNNTEQRYTRPALNETVFTGIEAVYQPVERFGGKFNGVTLSPYGRTIQENDEKSFEKVLSQKKAEEDVEDTDNEVIDETTVTPLPQINAVPTAVPSTGIKPVPLQQPGNQKEMEQGAQAIANLNMLSASTADANVASRDNMINWFVGLKTKRDSNDATWKQDYAQFYLNLEESNSELAKMFKTPGSPMLIGMPKSGIPLENVIDMLRNMNPTQVAELDKYRC